MEELGRRRGELTNMESDGNGRTRLEYHIPARGLIGFQGEFLTLTRGTGLMSHVFDDYAPVKPDMPGRHNVYWFLKSKVKPLLTPCGTWKTAAVCSFLQTTKSTKA